MRLFLAPALALVALTGCNGETGTAPVAGEALPTVAAPQGAKWTDTVAKTAAGGFLMGNPDAPMKLVEYGSLTCPACADFSEKAMPEVRQLIDSGRLSLEFRNFLLNPYDVPISLLTRCGDASAFFPLTEQFYAEQATVLQALQSVPEASIQAAINSPENVRYAAIADAAGLLPFFQQRGISADQARACLTDPARAKELLDLTETGATKDEVQGTPSFTLNGAKVEYQGWPDLKTKLMEAGLR